MDLAFRRITLYGRQRPGTHGITETLQILSQNLLSAGVDVLIETETAALLPENTHKTVAFEALDQRCDLVIVVGGDGSILRAIRAAAPYNIPVLGINRGRLGFLTDISPDEIQQRILPILQGEFIREQRFLLHTQLAEQANGPLQSALNDVVLAPGQAPNMIEFEIFINRKPVCSQRADGLIIATPTGSTAYALSGGGPIVHPSLDAIVLVPMFPHTLSSRPIVVSAASQIDVLIDPNTHFPPMVSCDGQTPYPIQPGESFSVQKDPHPVQLIHPTDYNYYETLRSKLKWETKH